MEKEIVVMVHQLDRVSVVRILCVLFLELELVHEIVALIVCEFVAAAVSLDFVFGRVGFGMRYGVGLAIQLRSWWEIELDVLVYVAQRRSV